jgi:hypothetical protein
MRDPGHHRARPARERLITSTWNCLSKKSLIKMKPGQSLLVRL